MNVDAIVRNLKALPADRRAMLVVRSMPFGDIIEDDTGKVHVVAQQSRDWPETAYEICRKAKQ